MTRSPIRALTLDAMGCLVTMRDPVPAIARLLADRGTPRPDDAIAVALRREISFYKAHHIEARDPEALRALQVRAAGVLAEGLDLGRDCASVDVGDRGSAATGEKGPATTGDRVRTPPGKTGPAPAGDRGSAVTGKTGPAPAGNRGSAATPIAVDDAFVDGFLAALEFVPLDGVLDALERLDAAGVPMVCVSNWDAGLPGHLERLGIGRYLRGVVTSGAVGVAKPDPRIFDAAVDLLDVPRDAIAHVGDEPGDRAGALAAGLRFLPAPVSTLPERLGLG